MRKHLLIVLFFLFAYTVRAQEVESDFPKWAVTVKPMGFFDPFLPNFTFGVQHYTGGKIMSEFQAGLIQTWYCNPYQEDINLSMTGFKVGGEIKYLFFRKMYVSAQLFHNNYWESSEELLWRYNRVYTQEMQLDKHITATGGNFKFGVFLHVPDQRLFFEFYGGLGIRYRTINIYDFPEDAEFVEPVSFFSQDHFAGKLPDRLTSDLNAQQFYASVALGFAIGFKLGK